MKRFAIALAAGALAVPAATLAQHIIVPAAPPAPVIYSAPPPQTGVAYYCANPQGWYPSVQGCSAQWVAYSQPQPVVQLVPGPAPAAQSGVTYWCGNPQGWYPAVQRCSIAWAPYTQTQTTYVVATQPAYVVVPPQAAAALDSASAVYYVGSHRNAPYQSGIFP